MIEDEMVRQHHRLNRHESEQTLGDSGNKIMSLVLDILSLGLLMVPGREDYKELQTQIGLIYKCGSHLCTGGSCNHWDR